MKKAQYSAREFNKIINLSQCWSFIKKLHDALIRKIEVSIEIVNYKLQFQLN